jgi:hypothetical protein
VFTNPVHLDVKPACRTSLFAVGPDPCEEPYAAPNNVEERPPLLI